VSVSPDPLGPVVITSREIYDQLVRLTTGVNDLIKDVRGAEGKLIDYETRIRALERRQWPLPVIGVLVSLAATAVALVALITR
jgi:hypothetical protein